jgi:hypothetical protein
MPSRQFLGIPNWVMISLHRFLGVFTHARSQMIHFSPLNPPMCQLRVRNVGNNDHTRANPRELGH